MNWSRLILGFLLLVVVLATGLGAWAYANRGYQDVVYYYRYTLPGTTRHPGLAFEVWDGPLWHRMRARATDWTNTTHDWVYRDGYQYDLNVSGGGRTPFHESAGLLQVDAGLRSGGLPRLNALWYAWATGRRSRTIFQGHAALRVDFGRGDAEWLDPHTHALIGQRFTDVDKTLVTHIYTRWARYAPYSLSVGFFDAPRPRSALWDRLLGWLRDRLDF